jgi:formamidopyrimidine-DNA glycosylase
VWLADDPAAVDAVIGPQGPDAGAVTERQLADRIAARRGAIKPALMDQRFIAGLGNMLSDEVLWTAGIDPTRPARSLTGDEIHSLHAALRRVVRRSARAGHIPRTPAWLSSQRSAEAPVCPRCGQPLQRRTVNGRTSFSCPACQR